MAKTKDELFNEFQNEENAVETSVETSGQSLYDEAFTFTAIRRIKTGIQSKSQRISSTGEVIRSTEMFDQYRVSPEVKSLLEERGVKTYGDVVYVRTTSDVVYESPVLKAMKFASPNKEGLFFWRIVLSKTDEQRETSANEIALERKKEKLQAKTQSDIIQAFKELASAGMDTQILTEQLTKKLLELM